MPQTYLLYSLNAFGFKYDIFGDELNRHMFGGGHVLSCVYQPKFTLPNDHLQFECIHLQRSRDMISSCQQPTTSFYSPAKGQHFHGT